MFDKYIIVPQGFRNIGENGAARGFRLEIRIPHHCGIWLSIIEEFSLQVDGKPVPKESVTLILHGNTYKLAELEHEHEDRWNFGEQGAIEVDMPGGLAGGYHDIAVYLGLRVSFLAWLLEGRDEKRLLLEEL
jgi:hypothetical protein